jgi:sugar transferase EpsL
MNYTFYKRIGKRIFDLVLLIPGLIIVLPFMGLIALLVYFKLGKPVLYKQSRPGLNGKPFVIYKFRTMLDLKDDKGKLVPNEKRLTPFGLRLRSTSLDELPELINILRGDMSLVGPRPLLREYLDRYTKEQARRHDIKPGITGWAQINGRNTITWEEKFKYDVWYVDNVSFILDVKILFQTVKKVILREGISPSDKLIMDKFKGNYKEDISR